MDWQAFDDATKAWFAQLSGIDVRDVVWKGEPEGMLLRPCAFLSLLAQRTTLGADEALPVSQGAGLDALIRMRGNRSFTLSCKVRTRDQSPAGRAYTLLERVQDGLYLPSSQAFYASVGVGLIAPVMLADSSRVYDDREESEAVLDIQLSYVLDAVSSTETLGTIERARIGGATGSITVPERVIP